jgi:hypothetical protein
VGLRWHSRLHRVRVLWLWRMLLAQVTLVLHRLFWCHGVLRHRLCRNAWSTAANLGMCIVLGGLDIVITINAIFCPAGGLGRVQACLYASD